jgi:hypothetical protein
MPGTGAPGAGRMSATRWPIYLTYTLHSSPSVFGPPSRDTIPSARIADRTQCSIVSVIETLLFGSCPEDAGQCHRDRGRLCRFVLQPSTALRERRGGAAAILEFHSYPKPSRCQPVECQRFQPVLPGQFQQPAKLQPAVVPAHVEQCLLHQQDHCPEQWRAGSA